ncbi:MAG: translation initiation factor IF-6 [Halobacteriota archaeon]|nr:translation initiation factor IF-6 [Halobacteriota archaeon]
MIRRFSFDGNPNLGIFASCTNELVLLPLYSKDKIVQEVKESLSADIAITTLIGDSSVLGSLACGNSSGMLVSPNISSGEMKKIEEYTKVSTFPGILNAVGNLVLANDSAALVHPKLSEKAVEVIKDTLKVDVYKGMIGGLKTVGVLGVVTNKGLLVHTRVKDSEISLLDDAFGLPVDVGTVNLGNPLVGSALIANDKGYVVGSETTGHELGRIEGALGFV